MKGEGIMSMLKEQLNLCLNDVAVVLLENGCLEQKIMLVVIRHWLLKVLF